MRRPLERGSGPVRHLAQLTHRKRGPGHLGVLGALRLAHEHLKAAHGTLTLGQTGRNHLIGAGIFARADHESRREM